MPSFLRSRPAQVLSVLLVLEALVFHLMPSDEAVPLTRPLEEFPTEVAGWKMQGEYPIEEEVQELLKADHTLNRVYQDPKRGLLLNLFVAYFRSQRAGVSPHSPKVCLPGSGWEAKASRVVTIQLPGHSRPLHVNRYLVSRDAQRSVVLYWYQTPRRVVANEYLAKLYLMLDSIRYHRSDTALVRIVAPAGEAGEAAADDAALRMLEAFFDPLRNFLPH